MLICLSALFFFFYHLEISICPSTRRNRCCCAFDYAMIFYTFPLPFSFFFFLFFGEFFFFLLLVIVVASVLLNSFLCAYALLVFVLLAFNVGKICNFICSPLFAQILIFTSTDSALWENKNKREYKLQKKCWKRAKNERLK